MFVFLIPLAFCLGALCFGFAGYCSRAKEGNGIVLGVFFGVILLFAAGAGTYRLTHDNNIGFSATENDLEGGAVYQLVYQYDLGGRHLAWLVEVNETLSLVNNKSEPRQYQLKEPLPKAYTYFKVVKKDEGKIIIFDPLPLEPPKK